MSTALLQELHQEVRRLYIAGSDLAQGDFRLKRLLPQFEQLGERSPVFKKLAEGISEVIAPEAQETNTSAEKLNDLGLLLSSVLRTLGTTSVEGELTAVKSYPNTLTTKQSFRKLVNVLEAFSPAGNYYRYVILSQSVEEGMFKDLRLLPYAIAALEDQFIADLVERKILPSYGSQIVPHLLSSFDASGGKLHVRKLNVIAEVGGAEVEECLLHAAQHGSNEVREVAIQHLWKFKHYESELLIFSKEQRLGIRRAAYSALARIGSKLAAARIYEAFSGSDMEVARDAIYTCEDSELIEWLVQDLERELKQVIEIVEDKKLQESSYKKIECILNALGRKQSDSLYDLYVSLISSYVSYKSLNEVDLFYHAAQYLVGSNTEVALNKLHELEIHDTSYTKYAFDNALPQLSPSQFYERYAIWSEAVKVKKNVKRRQNEIIELIKKVVVKEEYGDYQVPWGKKELYMTFTSMLSTDQIAQEWDERWLDWVVAQREFTLVCVFARPGHPAAKQFLLDTLAKPPKQSEDFAGTLLRGLRRLGENDELLQEALMKLIETTKCDLHDPYVLEQLYQLPVTYHDRLVAVLPNYRRPILDALLYTQDQMKSATGAQAEV
ncbi:HEAT repeat domain-containing protein [Paenibacillus agilis]|uniref:HEAT repeat domain-containing protein n=1 Tax=Paenibacillus agilis TaxID=3020863 RepID=A0A559IVR3_9BACL|nr:HEAT repeat domain-containing protein [Paenibacillus agilis]TVX91704.1 HEAT repeat domain-containing protein [Paenibacillus agilis]